MRRLFVLAALLASAPAAAQTTSDPPPFELLSRTLFHMSGERLSEDDNRFVWEGHIGGEVDLVDYRGGRAMFVANYQVMLGDELRNFDPNQGNYILEGSASARLPAVEVAGVFYHQSRHLSDRPKLPPVDWNMLGVRVRGTRALGEARIDARADFRGAIKKSSVDYDWELDARLDSVFGVRRRVGVVGNVMLRVLGVDGTGDRGTQAGFRAEGGVRIEGRAGALVLFLAGERRIDPSLFDFATRTWAAAGFRLLSR